MNSNLNMIAYGPDETQYIIDHRHEYSSNILATKVSAIFGTNRTHFSISAKLRRMGLLHPKIGSYSEDENALIETFIDDPDLDELIKQLTEKFGTNRSRSSVISKISRLRGELKKSKPSAQIMRNQDKITVMVPVKKMKTSRASISTGQFMHAMSSAEYKVKALAIKIGLPEAHILDMLTRTGVCKRYAPAIRAALGMKGATT